jgi:hypothetical protein
VEDIRAQAVYDRMTVKTRIMDHDCRKPAAVRAALKKIKHDTDMKELTAAAHREFWSKK